MLRIPRFGGLLKNGEFRQNGRLLCFWGKNGAAEGKAGNLGRNGIFRRDAYAGDG